LSSGQGMVWFVAAIIAINLVIYFTDFLMKGEFRETQPIVEMWSSDEYPRPDNSWPRFGNSRFLSQTSTIRINKHNSDCRPNPTILYHLCGYNLSVYSK